MSGFDEEAVNRPCSKFSTFTSRRLGIGRLKDAGLAIGEHPLTDAARLGKGPLMAGERPAFVDETLVLVGEVQAFAEEEMVHCGKKEYEIDAFNS